MLKVKTYLKEVPGKGIGLFANENILVNTVIWQFDFPDIKIWDSKYLWDRKETMDFLKKYGWLEGEYWYLSADDDRFTNHSSNSNTYTEANKVFAKRFIAKGEEITCNYLTFNDWMKENGLGFEEK